MEARRTWRIGVDEAGYGPNLGPLVIAASAWRAPADVDLDAALSSVVDREGPVADGRILIADSKAVYQPGGGLAGLEHAVYAALGPVDSWDTLIRQLDADPVGALQQCPWREGFDPPLPIDLEASKAPEASKRLREVCVGARVDPPRLAARMVFPAEFNDLVAAHGTKGAALSFVSIGLARRLFDRAVDRGEPTEIVFDKHGGRNRYAALLQEHFSDGWIETRDESRAESRYRQGDHLAFRFRTRGEAEAPVALASMTAKLLREIAMKAFNEFWTREVPGVRPTAGYPVDAKRFRAAIAERQRELGVADHMLWRER